MPSILLVQGGYFHRGELFPPFRGKERRQSVFCFFFNIITPPPMAVSEVTLIQNNQYTIVGYPGATCSELQQCHIVWIYIIYLHVPAVG